MTVYIVVKFSKILGVFSTLQAARHFIVEKSQEEFTAWETQKAKFRETQYTKLSPSFQHFLNQTPRTVESLTSNYQIEVWDVQRAP